MNYLQRYRSNSKPSIRCRKCGRPCTDEALKVANDFFHPNCFTCKVCGVTLGKTGYFSQGEDCYCVFDYHRIFGTRCDFCGGFIEGEAVKCKGEAFHKRCFEQLDNRSKPSAGNRQQENKFQTSSMISSKSLENLEYPKCAGCKQEIHGGQALIALEQQWHTWCFTCNRCGKQLSGEYLGSCADAISAYICDPRDGIPLCEDDYLKLYGIICAGCGHYIVGKFLEVGDRNFHSECAHCVHCAEVFREGQEILIYKDDLFHSSCLQSSTLANSISPASSSRSEDDTMKGKNYSPTSKDFPRKGLFHQESINRNAFSNESPEFGNNSEKSTRKESFRKHSAPFNSRLDGQVQRNHHQTQFSTNSDVEKETSIFQRESESNHFTNKQSTQHDISRQNLASHNLQYGNVNKTPSTNRDIMRDDSSHYKQSIQHDISRQNLASHNLHYSDVNKTPSTNRDIMRDDSSQYKQSRQQSYHNGHNKNGNGELNKRGYYQESLQKQFNNNPSNRIPLTKRSVSTGAYHNDWKDDSSHRKLSNQQDSSINNFDKKSNHRQASYKQSISQQSDRNDAIQSGSHFTKFGDPNSSLISGSAHQENRSAFRKYSPGHSRTDNSDMESNNRQYYPSNNISAYRSPNRFTTGNNYPATSTDFNSNYNQQEDHGQRYSVATEENKVNNMLDHLDLQSGRDSPKSTKSSSNISRSKSMTMLKSPYKQGNNQHRMRSKSSAFDRPTNTGNRFNDDPYFDRQVQYF